MRSLILNIKLDIIFLLLLSKPIFAQDWIILPAADKHPVEHVTITGETNINCFECMYTKNPDDQDIFKFALNSSQLYEKVYEVYIPVQEFVCNNYLMYNDFQSLLKVNEHPFIKIGIDSIRVGDILYKPVLVLDISITITDITNIQPISCTIDDFSGSEINISGKTTIHLADYNIKPPVKFMGLVKVKDEITISFSFNFIVLL